MKIGDKIVIKRGFYSGAPGQIILAYGSGAWIVKLFNSYSDRVVKLEDDLEVETCSLQSE